MRTNAYIVITMMAVTAVTAARAAEGKELRFLHGCGDRVACLDMVFSPSGESVQSGGIVRKGSREDIRTENGEARVYRFIEFEIEIRASLQGGPVERHLILFEAHADGLDCTGFGNLTVPVIGYSGRRNPIILTDAGELELVEGPVEIGCKTCMVLIARDGRSVAARPVSPAWDLTFSNIVEESFSYDDSGVYVRRGPSCIQLKDDARFTAVAPALCAPVPARKANEPGLPGMARDPAGVLLDNPKSRYLMVLRHGGCT